MTEDAKRDEGEEMHGFDPAALPYATAISPDFADEVEAALNRHRAVLKELADAGD